MKSRDRKYEPSSEAVAALNELSQDPRNIVFVVSPASKALLHSWYHEKAPKLGLAAENGFFWRFDSRNKNESEWNQLIQVDDFMWIKQVRLIMKQYKDKTDGSYIEEKESTIIWNHKNAEYEFGKLQAKELKTYLKNVFEHLPIETYETKNTVQVVPQELKNDKLVRTLLE